MSCRILFHVESARRRSTAGGFTRAAPDTVSRVSVGGVEDAGFGQVPQIVLVLLDLLVAARQVQRHFRHVVNVAVADVPDFQFGRLHPLFEVNEVFQSCYAAAGGDVDIGNAELLGKLQGFVASVAGNL